MASKAQGHPTYRGIYAYDASKKPANPPKSSPMYRGIYAYVAANKP